MAAERVRIYDLAKKLNLSNKEVIDILTEQMNVSVKSHSSTITPEEAQKVSELAGKKAVKETSAPAFKPQPLETPAVTTTTTPTPKVSASPINNAVQDIQKKTQESTPQRPEEKKPQVQKEPYPSQRTDSNRPAQHPGRTESHSQPPQRQFDQSRDRRPFPQSDRPSGQGQGQARPFDQSRDRRPFPQPDRPSGQRQGQARPFDQSRDRRPFPPSDRPSGQGQGRPDRPPYDRPFHERPRERTQNRSQEPRRDDKRDFSPPHLRKTREPQGSSAITDRPQSLRPEGSPSHTPHEERPRPPFPQRTGPRHERPHPGSDGQMPGPDRNFHRPRPPKPSIGVVQEEPVKPEKLGIKRDFAKKKDKFKGKDDFKSEKHDDLKIQSKFLKKKKTKEESEAEEKVTEIAINTPLTVAELASKLKIGVASIIKQLMSSGILATVNQTLDVEAARQVTRDLGFGIIEINQKTKESIMAERAKEMKEDTLNLPERAPVVTIMGHVDHGKTTLLDSIRKTKHKIVSTEAGGITQSIGAYTAEINSKRIVFIDTPGHSAFTSMRARGAQVTDIVILVVAADDGIMPQTIEAINHAKAANVPIIVAVNKIDKAGADPEKTLQQLTEYGLIAEKWGGETIVVPVSALQDTNLDELLEYILLVAEVEQLRADPSKPAEGVVIESKLDKRKGAVATFLVQAGTLKIGDYVVAGEVGGKVRALLDDHGLRIQEAGPSTPVEIMGLPEIPEAGEIFQVVNSDKIMKEFIEKRKHEQRISRLDAIAPSQVKRELLLKGVQGDTKELNIIIKAGTHGAAEAVSSSVQQLESKKIFVKVVHLGIGDISEADVMLASASNAIIVGFGVKEDSNALRIAQDEGISIRKYDIIYQMLEDIEKTMMGLLEPEYKEIEVGTAEVRQVFTIGKTTKIAGCYVLEGKIIRNKEAKILRKGKEVFKGNIDQLKRFKDDAKEVASGYECGISFDKFNDIEVGDIIKVFAKEEIIRHTLV